MNKSTDPSDTQNAAPATEPDPQAAPSRKEIRAEIEKIKQENLSAQQLRMARKLAQKNDLEFTSDLDAVRVLRRNGIDPFVNDKVLGDGTVPQALQPGIQLPGPALEQAVADPKVEKRIHAVEEIRVQLVKRRRRRIAQTVAKLFFFVALPTLVAGYYFNSVATSMYSTKSEIIVQTNEPVSSASGGLGSLLQGSPLANSQDSIAVQGYLNSLGAMNRLIEDTNFVEAFKSPDIDPLQRMNETATQEDIYKIYKKRILIGYDPSEGIIKMEVVAPSAAESLAYSNKLIEYAEEQVDRLTQRLREDSLAAAEAGVKEQEQKLRAAQTNLLQKQTEFQTFSGEGSAANIAAQVEQMKSEILQREIALAQLRNNARPNQVKVRAEETAIEILNAQIERLNGSLVGANQAEMSAAQIAAELQIAESELAFREQLLLSSLTALEDARAATAQQTRYLALSVAPVAPDKPSYPRAFENTLISFLIFLGAYLFLAMTGSILREQVTT